MNCTGFTNNGALNGCAERMKKFDQQLAYRGGQAQQSALSS